MVLEEMEHFSFIGIRFRDGFSVANITLSRRLKAVLALIFKIDIDCEYYDFAVIVLRNKHFIILQTTN